MITIAKKRINDGIEFNRGTVVIYTEEGDRTVLSINHSMNNSLNNGFNNDCSVCFNFSHPCFEKIDNKWDVYLLYLSSNITEEDVTKLCNIVTGIITEKRIPDWMANLEYGKHKSEMRHTFIKYIEEK